MKKITSSQKKKLFWGIFSFIEAPWLYSLLSLKKQRRLSKKGDGFNL